jgi:hypothetical protein
MPNIADSSEAACQPPPRRVAWSRTGRDLRLVVGWTCVGIALFMAARAVRFRLAGDEHRASLQLWALLPMCLLVAAGDWVMRRERDLARLGEWVAARVTGARVVTGPKGATNYEISYEFELPFADVSRGRARVTRGVYEEFGQAGHSLDVLRHPRWPHRCKPVVAFRYVDFLPPVADAGQLPEPADPE